ncbi:hypothetical protein PO909_026245, partial [Leuciscus waleckii]
VVPLTPWLAPVVWEGTFDPTLIDSIYKQQNITIATTVFANYFVGLRVHYYVFTDHPEQVPAVKLSEEHHLTVLTVPSSNRWQEITLSSRLVNEADYVFSLDVDTKFYGRWGAETLGRLVGVIHPGYYQTPREQYPYERRPESQAFIPSTEGDYYYGEESHLNKYFLYNKPSKVLSPEYLWQDFKPHTDEVKIIRFSQVIKNYAAVRPNP